VYVHMYVSACVFAYMYPCSVCVYVVQNALHIFFCCKQLIDILEILLHQSAEVVEYLHEEHVKAIANLLNTFGREGKVRKLQHFLSSP